MKCPETVVLNGKKYHCNRRMRYTPHKLHGIRIQSDVKRTPIELIWSKEETTLDRRKRDAMRSAIHSH